VNDIEIVAEVNSALERSLRAEVVDITHTDDDDDELEIDGNNDFRSKGE
jgi:hypothetical protein